MSPSLSMLRVTSTEDVDAASSVLVSVLCTPWRGTAASTCWCVDSGEILATSDVSAQIVSWAVDSACRVSLPDSEVCPFFFFLAFFLWKEQGVRAGGQHHALSPLWPNTQRTSFFLCFTVSLSACA